MLFHPKNNELIFKGEKKFTIRKGDVRKRYKVGHIYKCKNKLFSKDCFAKIKILSIVVKKFEDLTIEDALHDLFDSLEECKKTLIEYNGGKITEGLVSIINFEVEDGN